MPVGFEYPKVGWKLIERGTVRNMEARGQMDPADGEDEET